MPDDAMTATACPWCRTPNDATSVPVGKHGVLFHDACRKAGDQAVRIAAQAQDARRMAEQEQAERDLRIRRHRSPHVPETDRPERQALWLEDA